MSQDAERHRPLERCLKLARLVNDKPAMPRLRALADAIGVESIRTVRRYLVVLKRAGWPLPPFNGHDWRTIPTRRARR